jgi:hypothetical protein
MAALLGGHCSTPKYGGSAAVLRAAEQSWSSCAVADCCGNNSGGSNSYQHQKADGQRKGVYQVGNVVVNKDRVC